MTMILEKIKRLDPVMTIAWILAIISAFFIHPDKEYVNYIDFRSLGILWGLMIIIQGLKKENVFDLLANKLIKRFNKDWQLMAVLVFICFFSSMLITNDVALITFVPIAIMILKGADKENLLIPVIVLQTVAANLGSMLTPIGNPQNLYMYGKTGMSLISFCGIMFPYSLVSFIGLGLAIFIVEKAIASVNSLEKSVEKDLENKKEVEKLSTDNRGKLAILLFSLAFIVAILTVARIVPYLYFDAVVLIIILLMDRELIVSADYTLLLTFIGFFIFTGNMGRLDFVRELLEKLMNGREFAIALITSQFISNVPATLMLSGFTTCYKELIIGVNVGGLGTLIASMASLISYKAYTKEYKENTGKYMKEFTLTNLIFLVLLVILWAIL